RRRGGGGRTVGRDGPGPLRAWPGARLKAKAPPAGPSRVGSFLECDKSRGLRMLQHVVGWLRAEARTGRAHGRWARWIGRSWARVSYGYRVEPTWLEVNHCEIPVPGLPPSFAGFRLVQLSDFHCSRQVTPAYLAEAVDLAQAEAPDLVVLTGDFVHRGYKYVNAAARQLGRLSAPHGVFAVLGNHDFSVRNALGFRRYR